MLRIQGSNLGYPFDFSKGGIAMTHRVAFLISFLILSVPAYAAAGDVAPSNSSGRPSEKATFSMF